jgi:polyhydroxybutyrate depolymerase
MPTRTFALAAMTAAFALALAGSAAAQLMNKTVDVDGVTRQYLMYLPSGYDGATDLPVMIIYHGGDMTSAEMLGLVDMRPLANADDVILTYPQGLPELGGGPIWNSEGPFSNGVDDIGFTAAMIDDMDAQFAVDTTRVYACGYSNGANMAWEVGCLLSDRIAAVGPVAGSLWQWTQDMCSQTRPVPVLSIHGTQDFYNPYGGNAFSVGLIEASEDYVANANCDPAPTVVNVPNTVPGDGSTATHFTWSDGDQCVEVEHYRINNGGHDWPGVFGNMDIDSSQLIWDFCLQYSLNGKLDCCVVTPLGVGVGGANIADLDASPPLLGTTLQFDFDGFTGAGSGFLVLSFATLPLNLLGGTIYPDVVGPFALLPVSTGGGGAGSLGIPLGTDPVIVGVPTWVQVAMPDATQVKGWAFSNGLEFSVCE